MIYELTAKNDRQLCLCIRLLAAEKIPFTLTVHSEKKVYYTVKVKATKQRYEEVKEKYRIMIS